MSGFDQQKKTGEAKAVDVGADDQSTQGPDRKTLSQAGDAAVTRMAGVGGLGRDIDENVKHGAIKDAAIDIGGGAVGIAEKWLPFFKYSVTPYEAQVSAKLYRGSRVDENGMANLSKQGITGIVNLCAENDMDSAPAGKMGMTARHIPIIDNTAPTPAQVQTFLDFVAGNNGPVYVHCEAGQGRTGTMCAAYRMAVEGWSAQQAVDEAKKYGMKMPCQIHFLEQYGADLQGAPAMTAATPPPGDKTT